MHKKYTIEIIKEIFINNGDILKSSKYINIQDKLDYVCKNGHNHSITFAHYLQGRRCPVCAADRRRTKIETIGANFESYGYQLLTKKYINNRQKLEYICPKGHRHSVSWKNWCKNRRCPYCSGVVKKTMGFIKSEFEKESYIFESTKYINGKQKLGYICPNGHEHSISWNNWQVGYRCPYCAGNGKLTIEFIRSEFKDEGCILESTEYINSKQKLDYTCPEGHKGSISWDNWRAGKRCPMCAVINNSGSEHYNWKGGIACEPYCPVWLDKEFKQMILERDNYECQNPNCWGTGSKLTGHHIDYDKKNCDPFNIITICDSCNSRANYNREYWTKFYREIMNKKYGYIYERTSRQSI